MKLQMIKIVLLLGCLHFSHAEAFVLTVEEVSRDASQATWVVTAKTKWWSGTQKIKFNKLTKRYLGSQATENRRFIEALLYSPQTDVVKYDVVAEAPDCIHGCKPVGVPEPGTFILLALGVLVLALVRRRIKSGE